LSQSPITDELSTLIPAMDKDYICPVFNANYQVFGNFQELWKRREELGLTQRNIALALGKTDQTISNWETGIYEPKMTPRETKVLCRLLIRSCVQT